MSELLKKYGFEGLSFKTVIPPDLPPPDRLKLAEQRIEKDQELSEPRIQTIQERGVPSTNNLLQLIGKLLSVGTQERMDSDVVDHIYKSVGLEHLKPSIEKQFTRDDVEKDKLLIQQLELQQNLTTSDKRKLKSIKQRLQEREDELQVESKQEESKQEDSDDTIKKITDTDEIKDKKITDEIKELLRGKKPFNIMGHKDLNEMYRNLIKQTDITKGDINNLSKQLNNKPFSQLNLKQKRILFDKLGQ